jgi:two-component system chemotaxis sensor kinase CheA
MDDPLREFLTECLEGIAVLDGELVRLEQQPNDPALIAGIFRRVHSIKGTCGFFDLARLEALTHATETVLGKLRDGELIADRAIVDALFDAIDRIAVILDGLATHRTEPAGNDAALIDVLERLDASDRLPDASRAPVAGRPIVAGAQRTAAADPPNMAEPGATTPEPRNGAGKTSPAVQSVRVPVDLLENLTTLVVELELTRDQLLQTVSIDSDPTRRSLLQRLDRITGALQQEMTKTRLQPIGTVCRTLPRLVRDLAIVLDKEIELEMHGTAIELDRQVLETIRNPLTHMVRNAAVHGLEAPDERSRLGKPRKGTIGLAARAEDGHIAIEVSDDGRGLDTARIAEQAIARGLVGEAAISAMTDRDIQRFVFHPGLSTVETVTALSGRGVGMDVVRTGIDKIGGSIDIRSTKREGSTFRLEIPLNRAVCGSTVESGGERLARPVPDVVESAGSAGRSAPRTDSEDGTRLLRRRDRPLPLASLAATPSLAAPDTEPADAGS